VGDFSVDIGGANGEIRGLRFEIADLAEEAFVIGLLERPAGMGLMVAIDPLLQFVAMAEKRAIARSELVHQRIKAGPECLGRNAGAGQRFACQERVQFFGNPQAANPDVVHCCRSHITLILWEIDRRVMYVRTGEVNTYCRRAESPSAGSGWHRQRALRSPYISAS